VVALSRRDCLLQDDRLYYSRLEDFYFFKPDPNYLDPQWRVFRHREVEYNDTIHTPGFKVEPPIQLAPQEAYFIHLDWVLRTYEERLAKLKNYELQKKGSGVNFAQFYLPELHNPNDLKLTTFETGEFDSLARSVAAPQSNLAVKAMKDTTRFHDHDLSAFI
jgi:hypothetical protein